MPNMNVVVCPDCRGEGEVVDPRYAHLIQPHLPGFQCKRCKGTGELAPEHCPCCHKYEPVTSTGTCDHCTQRGYVVGRRGVRRLGDYDG